ncbi:MULTISPECIES: C40 family peptidase [Streptomycetaceae]|uniref:Uncharacterized protein n=1 Tax=Streptantibioticus cattleyicolor (strain ATCC 35852 / DSM 46488 / JCM 4925 / NBRC 14057 / NRRL 8057) TaxID=1003195 RepID=F8JW00_STREN|nr:hypothetical protein [Streptantibioticus cattleyicolor]AEW92784.1 hypothetical protein SCATT_04130 [Streptantibioticus cattleyicolor NRRL 8057 = DSM 46488]MYS57547.1 hypothetical protein [Streptomyces sp. SID5468]CCB73139.1 protein of unknown function [Streptantibioticus cattleyicolor NRRL 8057 = DSM 46488]
MIHPHPVPGDIGLTTISGAVGKLIRLGQWLNGNGFGDYEHAFVVLPGERILEAEPGGARVRPLTAYDGAVVRYVYPPGLTDEQRTAVCAAARAYVGVPYSFLDYLAIALHRFRLWVPGLRRYIAGTGHMICSQLADQCYQDAGVRLFADGRWPGYVTPMALYDLLAADT